LVATNKGKEVLFELGEIPTFGLSTGFRTLDKIVLMTFPIKTCVVCGEEFELRPNKPGFANRCPECSAPDMDDGVDKKSMTAEERKAESEVNAERRKVIRDLLYRKDR
jgi:hypothetical protein